MARAQVIITGGTRKPSSESLGTSSTGDLVIEVDLAKFTYINDLKAAVAKAMLEYAGMLKP